MRLGGNRPGVNRGSLFIPVGVGRSAWENPNPKFRIDGMIVEAPLRERAKLRKLRAMLATMAPTIQFMPLARVEIHCGSTNLRKSPLLQIYKTCTHNQTQATQARRQRRPLHVWRFWGIEDKAQKIVCVVDASGLMIHRLPLVTWQKLHCRNQS